MKWSGIFCPTSVTRYMGVENNQTCDISVSSAQRMLSITITQIALNLHESGRGDTITFRAKAPIVDSWLKVSPSPASREQYLESRSAQDRKLLVVSHLGKVVRTAETKIDDRSCVPTQKIGKRVFFVATEGLPIVHKKFNLNTRSSS